MAQRGKWRQAVACRRRGSSPALRAGSSSCGTRAGVLGFRSFEETAPAGEAGGPPPSPDPAGRHPPPPPGEETIVNQLPGVALSRNATPQAGEHDQKKSEPPRCVDPIAQPDTLKWGWYRRCRGTRLRGKGVSTAEASTRHRQQASIRSPTKTAATNPVDPPTPAATAAAVLFDIERPDVVILCFRTGLSMSIPPSGGTIPSVALSQPEPTHMTTFCPMLMIYLHAWFQDILPM